ncbi:hypothetical protein NZD89_23135 [Alicyclobacillus fastidiosus]|uniref:Uncharacterized protein n=1 Tax=Alicyclobacillus fastidiosus TaxID=392011 RepID=A0ABY6ZE17_9BACL|nr:hypothetical protein [Alicyclobacillus fastidiosus]WAH41130.1 hypothetical protein NZD89_23135 [Alicyclobacillus fastidiosus]
MKGFGLIISLVCVAIVTFLSMILNAPIFVFAVEVAAILVLDICIVAAGFRRDGKRKQEKGSAQRRKRTRKATPNRNQRKGRYAS